MKYPAGSSYHLTRLVFMKTSPPALSPSCYGKTLFFRYRKNLLQQQGIVAVHNYAHYNATHKRREKRRSSLKWVVQVHCSMVMSVHMTHQYLSECGAVKYPRLVIEQRHEMCFYAFIDCHLQCTTAVIMSPVLFLISNIRGCL